ncbi:hypothetical protein AGMMS50230_20230 [Spirochaetia bacterium]|nr:hypothetical protein AGMMS50230_20230 [Spirochaetia bacterium]
MTARMKLPVLLSVSFKYLWSYRRRYLFLFLTLAFSFGVVTVISSLKDGMEEGLYFSAQSHYAGDIVADGRESGSSTDHLTETEMTAIFAAAEAVNITTSSLAIRTTRSGRREGAIYFNGNEAALKYVVGVDWEREKSYFSKLLYTGEPGFTDDQSILLSAPIAQELGARQGDSVVLETLTTLGEKNTGNFVVAGIVEDSSFFGYYKVYVSRLTLNRLIGFNDGDCSLIGFFLPSRSGIKEKREALHRELSSRITTGPLVYDRDGFDEAYRQIESGIVTFLLTLPVYLSEAAQVMDAIDLAFLVLFSMMLAIIMVSAAVTSRLILHERIRETGTMRAIGFYEADVRLIFKLEIFTMALFSMIAGFFLALLINVILSGTSFTWVPGFEVFLQNGRLSARYLPGTIVVNIAAVGCMLGLAIWGPIFRNSRNPLPEMLSGGAL